MNELVTSEIYGWFLPLYYFSYFLKIKMPIELDTYFNRDPSYNMEKNRGLLPSNKFSVYWHSVSSLKNTKSFY